jgi:hypothetical protein
MRLSFLPRPVKIQSTSGHLLRARAIVERHGQFI